MGLRPAKTCREINKVAWTRFSKKKPDKSYVKAMPHNQVQIFNLGNPNNSYEITASLIAVRNVQVRDNALESARQAINKYLEKTIPNNYYFVVRTYPHQVIRENKMILGAGADRLQKGMRHSFGRPMDRAARIYNGQAIYSVKAFDKDMETIKESFKRAQAKLPGRFKLEVISLNEGVA